MIKMSQRFQEKFPQYAKFQGVTTGRVTSKPNCVNVEKTPAPIREFLVPKDPETKFVEVDLEEVEEKLKELYER